MGEQAGMLFRNPILQNPVHTQGNYRIGNFLALVVLVALGRLADDQVVRQIVRILEHNS